MWLGMRMTWTMVAYPMLGKLHFFESKTPLIERCVIILCTIKGEGESLLKLRNYDTMPSDYLGIFVVQLLRWVQFFATPWTAPCQASLSFTVPPRVCSNSCLLNQWCHPTISSSVVPFSSCPQSFPASGSSPMSPLFASGGQSIGASPSASVLPVNIPGWFPLGLTGLISLLSVRLSRVFSSTTAWKHQYSSALSLIYGPTLISMHDYWKNHSFD